MNQFDSMKNGGLKNINIAVLGFGTVGTGVYRVLNENRPDIEHREGLSITVSRILVRPPIDKPRGENAPKELFTTDINDIVNDESISIVAECIGGIEPARTYILQALKAGKTVVTSNKEVISKHWHEFHEAAQNSGAGLYIEATVAGGIPLIRTLQDGLQANNMNSIMGIINGTTNFILTNMSDEGLEFDDVLRAAQENGYAEADPTADVEGYDATYKLSILASLGFHTHIPVNAIHREGITKLTKADFKTARELGYEIKLLAIGKKRTVDGKRLVEVRVHPTMIKKSHPLASIRGPFNAVFLNGNAVGDVMLYGRGAGQLPTASAVVSDIIYACHNDGAHRHPTFKNIPDIDSGTLCLDDWQSIYCIRMRVNDQPGVLYAITGVFAKYNVSLKSVLQLDASVKSDGQEIAWITFVTHTAKELAVQGAAKTIGELDCVEEIESIIRVEE